jgi:Tol biopolymer transport system component
VAISALLARETNVFFSNDSRSIAYYTSIDNGVTTNYFLEIASIDGKTRTPLTAVVAPGPDFSATVTWSPDDSRLVYTDRDSLFAITKSGQSKINVGEGATPAWSPDGSSLAYIVAPGELAVSSNLGVNYRQLTNTPDIGEIHPVWSQDGRFIVVMSWSGDYDHSTTSIKRVEVATGAMKTLYTPGYLPVFVK